MTGLENFKLLQAAVLKKRFKIPRVLNLNLNRSDASSSQACKQILSLVLKYRFRVLSSTSCSSTLL